ncbi:ATP-dependent DNA helicase DinG [Bhargavaea beijingensis]|nr:ATP-dependent DNA helicase DinG [Bhargavaea beijingensis]
MDGKRYAVVDLETTGHSPKSGDRMIEIGMALVENGTVTRTYSTFLNPGRKIPAFISNLTGIRDSDVADAPIFEDRAAEIREWLEGCVFVAHNVSFDLPFLQHEFRRAGLPKWSGETIDTVELAKVICPSAPSFKLQDIAAEFGIGLENAHRAIEDAKATAELLIRLQKETERLPEPTLSLLHKRSFRLKSDLSSLFYSALRKKRRHAATEGGYLVWKGMAIKEPPHQKKRITADISYPGDPQEKESLLRHAFDPYEERPAQSAMMDAVHHTLELKSELAAEAATGIGKTFAYLLPAAVYALREGKPAVISTYTNHLTEQIIGRDLEKAERAIGVPLRAALLKGVGHYIDLERFAGILAATDESYDETLAILQVVVWLAGTKTGDLEELNVSGGGRLFLDKIRKYRAAVRDGELEKIDFYLRTLDFARNSDLIVTNHAMLLSAQDRGKSPFPPLSGMIIDEAHQFITAARSHAETLFSYTDFKYTIGQMGRSGEGLLQDRFVSLARKNGMPGEREAVRATEQYERAMDAFDAAFEGIQLLIQTLGEDRPHEQKRTYALADLEPLVHVCREAGERLYAYLDKVTELTVPLVSSWHHEPEIARFLSEWQHWIREIRLQAAGWMELFGPAGMDDAAAWIEADMRSIPGSLKIVRQPADVSGMIRKAVNPDGRFGVVWTSGTLSLPGRERFIADQIGLPETVEIRKFTAPPEFYRGAKMFIVSDMPDILNVPQQEYIESVADAVVQAVIATGGRCFVLFTSHDMLRKTYELIVDSELLAEYMLIAQGITPGSRMRLLKSFQRFSHSVLFGTDSFWEGVDAPGDALAAVIVVRLPFSSPENPLFKARAAKIAASGKNPFQELSLPEAIIKFRQGFGRLIRSTADRGAYIVLDRRIEKKSYGSEFIRALPPVPVEKVGLADMVIELESWYNDEV